MVAVEETGTGELELAAIDDEVVGAGEEEAESSGFGSAPSEASLLTGVGDAALSTREGVEGAELRGAALELVGVEIGLSALVGVCKSSCVLSLRTSKICTSAACSG